MSGADTPAKAALAEIDTLSINTIRTLAIDAVQKANSGHAGAPMALAPVAYTLWNRYLRYDPAHPHWPNRDRFVLSCGHASMLLYGLLHLAGVAESDGGNAPAVSLEDIKKFRQLDSRTPGHPEYHFTTGVETTTGPLGQGVANSVGMAMGSRFLGQHLNRPNLPLFDYNVYAVCSDGDLMEGVASEAASLAGHLRLANLCWIYDDNTITIEGHTELAFGEEVATRFLAYGWQVLRVADANDVHALAGSIETFLATNDRPTLIIVKSVIGYGAPKKQGTSKAHSDALGEDEVKGAKRAYGWPEDAQFLVPDGVQENFRDGIGKRGAGLYDAWQGLLAKAKEADAAHAEDLNAFLEGRLPEGWDKDIPVFEPDAKGLATRESSGKVLNAIAQHVPFLLGGSADLAPSNKSNLTFEGAGSFGPFSPGGRNLHFGVREHAMGSIVNGLGLSGLRAYGATFLVFADYMRPPIRLASLMELPVFHIFTHDSIGVGEDGPTHQPVEQLLSLRCIPGLVTLRPADANEVAEAYRVIFTLRNQPAVLALSRQPLPTLDRTKYGAASGTAKGGYVLADCDGTPDVILLASGSEVQLCVGAYEALKAEGVKARVVSMPSWDLFERQDRAYRDAVLPPAVKARVAVEQGSVIGWDRYAGSEGAVIGMHTFGASAPIKDLQTKFGFTPEKVLDAAKAQVAKHKK
ncbi:MULTISPECIES: transketolase [Methylobacterium]|uniref:Transketolase n=1 Tax=Methylobacterium radiotolerans (strain ATCC 27329 / DSM 1819 / JCM 2831 / NBRC 15690 / NCIMB 10815 / 0-1) TaxID=426355 RepID=B1LXU3_METRJ|nr:MULTISPECIES: transketolase [Methylobacterium]ACB24300.1 transketolase [Methylobacterium radiotolerans JCM 2831]KIU34060.1 transketolase [Methylobacterium radiotolerans]KZC02823.1 Transketolase [Methylobacterium radiotolerans]MBY0253257.1 transketolase [Methylobacterium organophilum]MDE3745946.1 transketolase [Methylobacterium radiotolerans]